MVTRISTLAAALALCIPGAQAGQTFEDYARVKDVTPEYERVNLPRKECTSERVPERYERRGGVAGPLIGGVAGGIIGAGVGRGNGRIAASAVGAVVGAIVGDRLQRAHHRDEEIYEREVTRCRMVDNWENRITGYRVLYEYQGRTYNAILPFDPGPRLAVNVSVEPIPAQPYVDERDRDHHYDERYDRR
jgi:uncharacterized protein YcfJ